jgi:hypothetical protein
MQELEDNDEKPKKIIKIIDRYKHHSENPNSCVNCFCKLGNNVISGVCYICKTNMITTTNVYKKYKLTKSDISTLYSVNCGGGGKCYFIDDIEKVVEKKINSLKKDDKVRIKLEELKTSKLKEKEKELLIEKRKGEIKEGTLVVFRKLPNVDKDSVEKIDIMTKNLIKSGAENIELSVSCVVDEIYFKVENEIKLINELKERDKKINLFVDNEIGNNYKKYAKNLHFYKNFIKNGDIKDIDVTINNIKDNVNKYIENNKINEILKIFNIKYYFIKDKLIKEKYINKFINGEINKDTFEKIADEMLNTYQEENSDFLKWLEKINHGKKSLHYKSDLRNVIDMELYNFCKNTKLQNIELTKYDNCARRYIHSRCDQLNIKHESVGPVSDRILRLEKTKDTNTKNINKKTYMCDNCGDYYTTDEMFKGVYVRGIYCDDCVEGDSDLEGMKFDPL